MGVRVIWGLMAGPVVIGSMSPVLPLLACTSNLPVEDTATPDDTATRDLPSDTIPSIPSGIPCEACDGDCLLEELTYPTSYHTREPIPYADLPPAGGPHHPCWAPWGVHTTALEDDNWVHNLEHGGVAWLRSCDDCPDEVAATETFVVAVGSFALSTPYPLMTSRFAAVSWGWRLTSSCYDADTYEAFYFAHFDQGPESTSSMPADDCM